MCRILVYRFSDHANVDVFILLFSRDGQKYINNLKRRILRYCLLINSFVSPRSHCRCLGLFQDPTIAVLPMSSYYFLQRTPFQGRVIGPSLFQRTQMISQSKELRLLVVDVTVFYLNREFKKITTSTGTSLNKSFNEQNNGCARALYIFVNFFASFAKQQHGITKLSPCIK